MRNFVDINNARKGEYKKVIKEIASTGKCPFCPENFKYHKKPIFLRKNGWFLTDNSWPYKNAKTHLLIIGQKHLENFAELTNRDLADVAYLTRFAVKKFEIKAGGLLVRFGDTRFTGASVSHIHFHLISPRANRSVSFPVG